MKVVFFILCFLLVTVASEAATYYVSATSGNDLNPCTGSGTNNAQNPSFPKRNISTKSGGISCMSSGDTLTIGPGTYNEPIANWALNGAMPFPGGSSGAPTTIQGAGMGSTIITGVPCPDCRGISFVTSDSNNTPWVTFKNFTVDTANINAGNQSHIVLDGIESVNVDSTNNNAIQAPGDFFELRNSHIHHMAGTGGSYGIYMAHTTANAIVEHTEFDHLPSYAIHNWSDMVQSNNIFRFNTIHDTGLNPALRSAGILISWSGWAGTGTLPNQAYGNVLYNNRIGIIVDPSCVNCPVYNNTIYNNALGGIESLGTTGTVIRNNILYNPAANLSISGSGNVTTNNLCFGAGGSTNCAIFADPLFVSPTPPNFQIQSGSPAVNQGTSTGSPAGNAFDIAGIARPQGSAFDIGAYEFSGVAIPSVVINSPVSSPTLAVTSASLTLGGTYTSTGGTGGVITWSCDRCGSGNRTGGTVAAWQIADITLLPGVNNITVTATDSGGTATDQIAVTYTPGHPGNALVGAWGFEGNGTDSSGNGNTAFLQGTATYTAVGLGKFGQGIDLDGVAGYALVSDSNSLDVAQSVTMTAWVFPTTVRNAWTSIMAKQVYVPQLYAGNGDGYCGVNGVSAFVKVNGSGTSAQQYNVCRTTPLPLNTWSHVGMTFDSVTLKLFINGQQVAASPAAGIMEPSNLALLIGRSFFGENFQGKIDDVRIYNWAIPLTADANNFLPGAQCVFGNPLDTAQQSIVRDMNCPVVSPPAPPITIKFPASATGLKVGAGATGLKFGSR